MCHEKNETQEIQQIIEQTKLFEITLMVISSPIDSQGRQDEEEICKCIKLEAGWVLTNLAYVSSSDLMSILVTPLNNGLNLLQLVKNILQTQPYDIVLID